MDLKTIKVGFIGGGNMAHAIGAGLIEKGVLDPKNIWVSAKTQTTLDNWSKLGTLTTLNNTDIVTNCDVTFLAIKPQILDDALRVVPKDPSKTKLFISILVGVTVETLIQKLERFTGLRDYNPFGVIRAMPNTPLMVGSGISVYCGDAEPEDFSLVHELFSHLGLTERVPESQMNAIGALSGSGPAFAYQIIEALSDGAVMAGVPRALATKFAAQVLAGSGKMVLETKKHPGQLKDEVCSPGGTTITGVHAMEEGGVRASMMNAIKAAVARSEQLALLSQK